MHGNIDTQVSILRAKLAGHTFQPSHISQIIKEAWIILFVSSLYVICCLLIVKGKSTQLD